MMHSTKKIRFTSAAIALGCAFGIAGDDSAQDQKAVTEKPTAKRISESGRDPFRKFEPPRLKEAIEPGRDTFDKGAHCAISSTEGRGDECSHGGTEAHDCFVAK